ncbi:hypothetical protein VNO77_41858 [Canavalia gladiata]|uniref:Bifunctional inhibitor/plant lipid transfer protein/seed storage helical domain-containing protein n=1 Tax=Canavalia gladiata TaxID=3824 RepID=A0AAN9PRW8_CANGL
MKQSVEEKSEGQSVAPYIIHKAHQFLAKFVYSPMTLISGFYINIGIEWVKLCIMLSVLLAGIKVLMAESCNIMELVPCANAFTTSTLPSPECCERLKEQQSCICQYMNDPTLVNFINTPNAKLISDTCGSPIPSNC